MEFSAEIKRDARALRAVSPMYAGRGGVLTATLQYFYQAIALGVCDVETARALEKLGAEKLRQLFTLGDLVTKLGASPVFTACPPFPVSYYSASCVEYGKTAASMLEADLRMERGLIERLSAILADLENPDAAAVLTRILSETQGHLAAVEGLVRETSRA